MLRNSCPQPSPKDRLTDGATVTHLPSGEECSSFRRIPMEECAAKDGGENTLSTTGPQGPSSSQQRDLSMTIMVPEGDLFAAEGQHCQGCWQLPLPSVLGRGAQHLLLCLWSKFVTTYILLGGLKFQSVSRETSRHWGALPALLLPKSQLPQHPTTEGR